MCIGPDADACVPLRCPRDEQAGPAAACSSRNECSFEALVTPSLHTCVLLSAVTEQVLGCAQSKQQQQQNTSQLWTGEEGSEKEESSEVASVKLCSTHVFFFSFVSRKEKRIQSFPSIDLRF